ncbi:MAG: helix-turn-helix domain-containing protein [Prevotella sp.]|nr:helix-turn-helix domain-containing protein [Prevotella sp.]
MKPRIIILTFLLMSVLSSFAQMGNRFDADKLLSSSFTNQVYLDRDGFIWAATRNGLSRYDGYRMNVLKKENKSGQTSNYVNCIIQDKDGLFYVGMFGGLQTFDGTNFHDVDIKVFRGNGSPGYVKCFCEGNSGELYVGTSGHGILQMTSKTEGKQLGGDLADIETINGMMVDKKGALWIATDKKGIFVYDKGKVTKKFFQDDDEQSQILCICQDQQGVVYVGLPNQGVYYLKGGSFVHLDATGNKTVSALYCNKAGEVMIGYDGAGIAVFYPQTGVLDDNPYYSNEVDLSLAKVVSITEDLGGNLWLGMLQKGVYMQPASKTEFGYMGYKMKNENLIGQACVTSTLIDSHGRKWIGTDKDGLYQINAANQLVRHYTSEVPATVLTLVEDKTGRVWLGGYQDGCGWIDLAGTYHPQPLPLGKYVSVFGLGCDAYNNVWFATMGNGLLRLSPDGDIKSYTMKNGADMDRKVNSIVNDFISKISISPDGKRVYLATTMGVCCLDIAKDSWTSTFGQNCLLYTSPIRIVKEYGGRLWIGTNEGLKSYDLKSKKIETLDVEKGIADNGIASIEVDEKGRLWISTDHGLCCHDPKTGKTENYFVDNGLQSNEFSDGASWVTSDGQMVFGGVGGITWFDPMKIHPTKWDATVKLSAFLVNGETVGRNTKSGSYEVCDTSVIACKEFNLCYHDNSFAIQLSTLTYDNPEHITYLYSINGEDFVRLQPGQNEITFSHLSPGTYKFRVKAEKNNQQSEETVFTVVVHRPWWQSWWAYCIYLALAGFLLWKYIRFRNRRMQEKLRLQEHIHAEQMGEAKLKFFMNISHEIRTPMTLIITPLMSLIKQDKDPHRQTIYATMKRNSDRILSLINQLMDLRKIDKGMMQMRMSETDLVGFVKDIHNLFESQAKSKQISFLFKHDTEELPVWIDKRQFDKVIVNILSNAFKFTPNGGEIVLKVTHDEHNASISISDDGEQIPVDKLEHIFKRFYQTTSSINDTHVGTGIGLDLTKSLVELHHGSIMAHNLEKGCEFVVTIPLGNSHLKEEEMQVDELQEMEEVKADMLEDSQQEEVIERKASGKKPVIVIAEDDDEIREYLSEVLEEDYEVQPCPNGKEALHEILKSMPDLVISDVMMPLMDGNALSAMLKSNPQTNHIPIILLTAKNRDDDKLEGLETGADAYIVKPFNMEILKRTIANLINSRQQLRLKYSRNDELESQVEKVKVKSPDEKLLERVMKVINDNISNSDLSVDYIAAEVGISRVHLHRKMKELTGQTPHDFIRNIRLKQAAHLLSTGDMNIAEVMYACGFSNSASFSTIFKKFYGMTPREYKK